MRDIQRSLDEWAGMRYLWTAFHWLAMSHTCHNPVILCWMNAKFRSGFSRVVERVPLLRSFLAARLATDAMSARASERSSRYGSRMVVTVTLKDESIVFKSRNCNNTSLAAISERRSETDD